MSSSFRFAGTVALCAALLLGACAKKTDETTTASTDTTVTTPAPAGDVATAAPDLSATVAPDATSGTASSGTSSTSGTTATTSNGTTTASVGNGTNGSGGGFVTLPVYPGATENKDGAMSAQSNTGSVEMHIYVTKDDTKKVADWYRTHLPSSFKGGMLTSGGKTVGTWSDEHADKSGDQSVIVASDDATQTRIQLTTKHGQ